MIRLKNILIVCCIAFCISSEISAAAMPLEKIDTAVTLSKNKQQKYFPAFIKERKVYFGMELAKFNQKNPAARQDATTFDFRTTFTEKIQTGPVEEIVYYFTTGSTPLLYEFIIKYRDMQTVQNNATKLLGSPNHNNTEWRISTKEIKEDFTMGIWTFGHKIVYATTLEGSEWENGFES